MNNAGTQCIGTYMYNAGTQCIGTYMYNAGTQRIAKRNHPCRNPAHKVIQSLVPEPSTLLHLDFRANPPKLA